MPAKMQALIAPPASMAVDFSQPAGWAASRAQWSGMMDAPHPDRHLAVRYVKCCPSTVGQF